jgi:acyl carrier protein
MEESDILKEFTIIFQDILDNEKITLSASTVARDIEEWDSLTHIQLIVAIEKHFKVRFLSSEIRNWKNVGEMIDSVKKKLNDNN